MTSPSSPETVRPPVALGCFFAAAVVVVVIGIFAFAIVFLESGADTGEVQLDVADAYAPGSVEFVGEHNFFLVRLLDGSFVALADLDAANRANEGARCRVGLVGINDPGLGATTQALRARMSARASGANMVLRETCFGVLYDLAGAVLATEGRNLDQYAVGARSGRVTVDRSERLCTVRSAAAEFAPIDC